MMVIIRTGKLRVVIFPAGKCFGLKGGFPNICLKKISAYTVHEFRTVFRRILGTKKTFEICNCEITGYELSWYEFTVSIWSNSIAVSVFFFALMRAIQVRKLRQPVGSNSYARD